jgi:hypothetical protein
MRKNTFIFLAVFLSFASVNFQAGPLANAESHPLLFIGQQKDVMENYAKEMGVPDGFMVYTSIQEMSSLEQPSDQGSGVQHAQYFVSHYPHAAIQLAVYMKGALEDTLAGKYDANIEHLAKWIKASHTTIYLRLGYEFDTADNGYEPMAYQKTYRYIVDRLRAHHLTNVQYVWHSAIVPNKTMNYMDWYPGDSYVDWFAISFFNTSQVKTAEEFFALAQAHHKLQMIAESTPAGMYTLKGKKHFYNFYFDFIKTHDIKAISYIDCNWDKLPMWANISWGDARVEKNPEIKEMWRTFLKDIGH